LTFASSAVLITAALGAAPSEAAAALPTAAVAFFCHRSANASLQRADLPGIQARFDLACSGGQPHDFAHPSQERPRGRAVAAQLDELRAVALTHDIDFVLVGLGSNNSQFTFGDVASECANRRRHDRRRAVSCTRSPDGTITVTS
jgi:hypothetical protein